MGVIDESLEVVEVAELLIDLLEIGDAVAESTAFDNGGGPERLDAGLAQLLQFLIHSLQVSLAVAIRVFEGRNPRLNSSTNKCSVATTALYFST